MLGLALDAFVLMGLLKMISDEEVEFWTACGLALVSAVGTAILANVLADAMGLWGLVLAALIAVGLLGIVVSAVCGVEVKRAMAIAGGFMLFHIALNVGFYLMSH